MKYSAIVEIDSKLQDVRIEAATDSEAAAKIAAYLMFDAQT